LTAPEASTQEMGYRFEFRIPDSTCRGALAVTIHVLLSVCNRMAVLQWQGSVRATQSWSLRPKKPWLHTWNPRAPLD
jgi:hypothetical protein